MPRCRTGRDGGNRIVGWRSLDEIRQPSQPVAPTVLGLRWARPPIGGNPRGSWLVDRGRVYGSPFHKQSPARDPGGALFYFRSPLGGSHLLHFEVLGLRRLTV